MFPSGPGAVHAPPLTPNLMLIDVSPGRSSGGTRQRDESCTCRRSPLQSEPVIKTWADAHANLPARARWIAKADVAP